MVKELKIRRVANISEILGSKGRRYCSNGFRNVDFSFSDFCFFGKGFFGKAHVSFKSVWSSKECSKREPHLGTAEYIAMSCLMVEAYLQNILGFNQREVAASWIQYVKLTAFPQVECGVLQSVFLLDKTLAQNDNEKGAFEIKIGNMQIRLVVRYPKDTRSLGATCEKLDVSKESFYKTGYKTIEHDIVNVENEYSEMRSSGNIVLNYAGQQYRGLGVDHLPTMDIVTFILISGQLIQALIYGLDNLSRDKTNNLWLRSLEIDYPEPWQMTDELRESVNCKSFRKVKLKGDIWRVADIVLSLGNMQATFNMAHQIS